MSQLTHNIKTFRRSQNLINVKDSFYTFRVGDYNKAINCTNKFICEKWEPI